MKQLFYVLLAATALFSSCSSDNDIVSQKDGNSNNSTKKYTVNFNVKSAGFEVDKTPLKAATIGSTNFLQVVVYKESGEVYSDSVIYADKLKDLIQEDNTVPFTLDLPAGNYHLSLFTAPLSWQVPGSSYVYSIMHPKYYETDTYSYQTPNPTNTRSNIDVYYYTSDLNVSPSGNNLPSDSIVLDPMWSEVTITLSGLSTAKFPERTNYIRMIYNSYYYGFGIKSKLAIGTMIPGYTGDALGFFGVPLNGSDTATMTYYPAKGIDDSMGLTIEFLRNEPELQRLIMLGSKKFNFSNKFENGKRYKISGNIKEIDLQSPSFAITINDLNSEDIDIPFE